MRKQTLLEKAKSIPTNHKTRREISEEEIELAIAWLTGDITLTQAAKVMHATPGGIVSRMALSIREAYRAGIIKVKA